MPMPAGQYYIGDLCYVLKQEWDEFCAITIKGYDGEFELADGRRFAIYSTMHGDGTYTASNGVKLSVDAGLIGCIKVEDIHNDLSDDRIRQFGTIVDFDSPFKTGSYGGIICFGHISVDTDAYDEDEDEDDYEDDYDDEDEAY